MDNINLKCGHCGKLMAVAPTSLGQQVRCPHCQTVVQTRPADKAAPQNSTPKNLLDELPAPPEPSWATEPPSLPLPSILPLSEEDQKKLFGDGSPPDLPLPAVLPAPTLSALAGTTAAENHAPPEPAWPKMEVPEPPPIGSPFEEKGPMFPTSLPEPELPGGTPDSGLPSWISDAPEQRVATVSDTVPTQPFDSPDDSSQQDFVPRSLQPKAPRRDSMKWVIMFVIPLISWAVLATGLVVYLLLQNMQLQKNPGSKNPLERMPDDGDPRFPDREDEQLSSDLRTRINKPIRIGELEVEPKLVEVRKLALSEDRIEQKKGKYDALVMHLQLTNKSKLPLKPLDYHFDRKNSPDKNQERRPFTYLALGSSLAFYGPLEGPENPRKQDPDRMARFVHITPPYPEEIAGRKVKPVQNHQEVLEPGDSMLDWICTDPNKPEVMDSFKRYDGKFLWRVQVRRGYETIKGKAVPITAVIGVEFTKDEIKHAQ